MRKRVAMAQNWIIDRAMVLMDEPFSALDVHTRQRMESELLALWDASGDAARRTVVFVTHDLEEAIALADEVVVLSAGPASRVVAHAPGDARSPARPDGAADVAGVRGPLSRDLGRCCARKSSGASAATGDD